MNNMTFPRMREEGSPGSNRGAAAVRLLLLAGLVVGASGSFCHRQPEPSFQIENVSNNPSYSDRPCIACTREGHVALAWSDYTTGHEEVWLVEKDKGGAWSAPYNLSKAGNINGSRGVSLCYDRDRTLHAAWSQFAPRGQAGAWTIVYTRRPPGGDWAVPETIWHGTAVVPHICADTSGAVHLEFEDMSSRSTICYSSRSSAGMWAPVLEVSAPYTAAIGTGGIGAYDDGTAVVVWERDEGPGEFGSLLWSERTLGGAWSPPAVVDFPARYCLGPTVGTNGNEAVLAFAASNPGQWLVVLTRRAHAPWSEPDTSCESRNPGMLAAALSSANVVVAAWVNAAEPAFRLARRDDEWAQAVVNDGRYVSMTTVAVDADDHVHLAWKGEPDYPLPGDIYYTEMDIGDLRK